MTAVTAGRPWYREPWVWLVIGVPASAVIAGIVMLIIAIVSFDGLVADDYYKRGLEINQDLRREQAAAAVGLTASIERGDGRLIVTLEASDPDFDYPDMVEVGLYHATRNGIDQRVLAYYLEERRYAAAIPELAPGRWNVGVSTPDWRVVTSTWSTTR